MYGYLLGGYIALVVFIFLVYAVGTSLLGMWLAGEKGYSRAAWFWLCFFFGVFGLIVMAGAPDRSGAEKSEQAYRVEREAIPVPAVTQAGIQERQDRILLELETVSKYFLEKIYAELKPPAIPKNIEEIKTVSDLGSLPEIKKFFDGVESRFGKNARDNYWGKYLERAMAEKKKLVEGKKKKGIYQSLEDVFEADFIQTVDSVRRIYGGNIGMSYFTEKGSEFGIAPEDVERMVEEYYAKKEGKL
jgi:hypothetical protein